MGGEVDALRVDDAGPVAAIDIAMGTGPGQKINRSVGQAGGGVGQRALSRLGSGDPRLVVHTPNTATVHHELVPLRREPCPSPLAGEHAGEDGVVPVHRPTVLRLEGAGLIAYDLGQDRGGEVPVGTAIAFDELR